jgi:hypothetical protein
VGTQRGPVLPALHASREDVRRVRAKWMAQPMWRRVGDIIFGTMLLAALLLLRLTWAFTWSVRYLVITCVVLLLPVLWFAGGKLRA